LYEFFSLVKIMGISLEHEDGEWYNALPHQGGIYDLISAAVSENGTEERLPAVVALGKSGDPRAVRPLVDLLTDPDVQIRLAAATALGSLKSGRPVDELIGRLQDRNEERAVREKAAAALTAIRSTGALRGLREFVADESEDPALRAYAGSLLGDIGSL
jgi:HEAT repeat protein